ncbi:MAG: hypothetical protein IJB73_00355 [Firmicutes bacterium]|nr:hypothetical protein [Bacillota bacterium]
MNNIKNENFTCEKLREIHMSQDPGVDFTREKFDAVIAAAEAERLRLRRRRKMIRAALLCLMLGAVCSSLIIGMCTWEKATADNDDKTRIVQQGDNLIIGSGIVGDSETVGVTVEEYASIEDIPEDIREKAHFITADGFEVEKVKVSRDRLFWSVDTIYELSSENLIVREDAIIERDNYNRNVISGDKEIVIEDVIVYKQKFANNIVFSLQLEDTYVSVSLNNNTKLKIETILEGLDII